MKHTFTHISEYTLRPGMWAALANAPEVQLRVQGHYSHDLLTL